VGLRFPGFFGQPVNHVESFLQVKTIVLPRAIRRFGYGVFLRVPNTIASAAVVRSDRITRSDRHALTCIGYCSIPNTSCVLSVAMAVFQKGSLKYSGTRGYGNGASTQAS
jgi:hypothetical protein